MTTDSEQAAREMPVPAVGRCEPTTCGHATHDPDCKGGQVREIKLRRCANCQRELNENACSRCHRISAKETGPGIAALSFKPAREPYVCAVSDEDLLPDVREGSWRR